MNEFVQNYRVLENIHFGFSADLITEAEEMTKSGELEIEIEGNKFSKDEHTGILSLSLALGRSIKKGSLVKVKVRGDLPMKK